MLTLLFLGRLEDMAGGPERALPVEGQMTLAEIAARLDDDLAASVTDAAVRIALNGTLVAAQDLRAGSGDEIAFLPPVSGG